MSNLIERQAAIDSVVKESQVDGAYGYMDTTDRQVTGKSEPCKDALDDAYAHGYTAAEAKFYQWRKEHECEDAVSRVAMRDEIDKLIKIHFDRSIVLTKAKQALFNLPSVMPVRDCKGCRFKFLPERKEEAEIEH